MKVWLASAALACGVLQLFTAAWIFRKLSVGKARVGQPRAPVDGTARVRPRAAGRVPLHLPARLPDRDDALVRTLARRQCVLRRLRREGDDRAFAALPVPVLPIAGGLLFTVLLVVWWTSALWFFRTIDTGF